LRDTTTILEYPRKAYWKWNTKAFLQHTMDAELNMRWERQGRRQRQYMKNKSIAYVHPWTM
jgi:hypothetical protein